MSISLYARIAQTALLVYVAALEGWCTGIFGPTLPELLCVFNTDLKTISSVFFVGGLMNAVGSIFGCYMLTLFKIHLLISIAAGIASLALLFFPYVGNVHAAIVLAGVSALCVGVLFNCRVFSASYMWPENPFAIHLAIAGFALGPVIASSLAEPFLPGSEITPNQTRTTSSPDHNMKCHSLPGYTSRVHYVFIILACFGIPLVITNCACYLYHHKEPSPYNVTLPIYRSNSNSRRGYILFLIFFFLLCMPAGGIFLTYGNLLSTFGVGSTLKIDASYMSLLTALFWGTFVTGRLLTTICSGFIRQIWIISFSYLGLFAASVILLVLGEQSSDYLALATGVFGIFCAPFSAASFSWAREHIELTGFVVALGSVGEYTGAMVCPYVGGMLMGHFGARAFFYVVVGIVTYQLFIFLCFYFIGTCILEPREQEQASLLKPTSNSED